MSIESGFSRWAAETFPQYTKGSGAAAVIAAADEATNAYQRLLEWQIKVAHALEIPTDTPPDAAAAIAADTLKRART